MQLSAGVQAQVAELIGIADALLQSGRGQEALDVLVGLRTVTPDDPRLLQLLGDVHFELGAHAEAAASYARAGSLDPSLSRHHMNLHHAYILRGAFAQAWKAYEWRLAERGGPVPTRQLPMPQWRGEPIAGKTILVHAEQGFGDAIQFLRYARTLKALGARVALDVFGPLAGLFRGFEGVDVLVGPGDPVPAADVHSPLMSLPLAFHLGGIVPLEVEAPYLRAPPEAEAHWARRLPPAGPKIGVVASGNPAHAHDSRRSIPLERLAEGLPAGPAYVLVQPAVRERDLPILDLRPDIVVAGAELGDYADAAGLCAALDLVVSVDTSVAHLAGALGRPTWLLLPHFPDWRWEVKGETTRWYPTLRLLRQAAADDWSAVTTAVGTGIKAAFGL